MFDPSHVLSGFRIPSDVLIALDYRPYHFAIQPYHFIIRALHLLSVAAFFGGIGVLDLRLMGARPGLPLKALSDLTQPWLYATFGVSFVTGLALFFYDPLHVGSHAYFTVKLLFMGLGLANAALFHRAGFAEALQTGGPLPRSARVAGALSLACWVVVMASASLNVEGVPKRFYNSGPSLQDVNR